MDAPIFLSDSQTTPDEIHVLAGPPPLDADALRISIVTRLDQYLALHAAGVNDSGSLDASQPVNHRNIQFRMVQSALVRDVKELSRLTLELERILLARRRRLWLIHISLALMSHALLTRLVPTLMAPLLRSRRSRLELSQRQSLGLGIPATLLYSLQWTGYPIAIYNIAASEKRVTETTSLRDDLFVMEMAVEKGAHVQDAFCLSVESWQYIPWEILRA